MEVAVAAVRGEEAVQGKARVAVVVLARAADAVVAEAWGLAVAVLAAAVRVCVPTAVQLLRTSKVYLVLR